MSSVWKKSMMWLGLGPDEAYDDYDPSRPDADEEVTVRQIESRRTSPAPSRTAGPRPVAERPPPESSQERPRRSRSPGAPRPSSPARPSDAETSRPRLVAQPVPSGRKEQPPAPQGQDYPSTVRKLPAARHAKPHVVSPTTFNDAQEVGDRFKRNQPVIVNLQGADRDLSRRLIDFASGLCYGLGGHMERVAQQVYLLTPADVEISAEDRRELRERGLHRT